MTPHCLGQYGPLGAQEVTGNPWGRGAGVSEGVVCGREGGSASGEVGVGGERESGVWRKGRG